MQLFAAPRPDHSPPETLTDEELAHAVDSLTRKLRSVRASLRTARLAWLVVVAVILASGFGLLWVGPDPFLPRIFGNGEVVTVPILLAWWVIVIGAGLFCGVVSYRLFTHRLHAVRGWRQKAHELERRLAHAQEEAERRSRAG